MTREKILVDNLKCGGCATSVKIALGNLQGISQVEVLPDECMVEFDSENEVAKSMAVEKLKNLGYPPQGTSTLVQKGKSYVSCVIGRVNSDG